MEQVLAAIEAGASGDEFAALPIPESFRAAVVRRDEVDMFEGVASADKDPTKSIHVDEVATPELAASKLHECVLPTDS